MTWRGRSSKDACIATSRATARIADCDLVGLGVSAISKIGPTYAQNVRELPEYYDRVNNGLGATARGLRLDRDDLVRRSVIMALMCHFEVSKEAIATAHLINFDEYFRRELASMTPFFEAGLVENTAEWLTVLPKGSAAIACGGDELRSLLKPRPARPPVLAHPVAPITVGAVQHLNPAGVIEPANL